MNYYNENDPKAAAWLRELIADKLIPIGCVDERSIEDVRPDELLGYTQCHFFAGIGGWSLALRLAGWPDDKPVWTGSCPCPPFSTAGKKKSCPDCGGKSNLCHPGKSGYFICLDCGCSRYADSRHLWPEFSRLIKECRPGTVFGEQVAGNYGRLWLSGVRADLESVGYGVWARDLCAAGIGAPHIRQRLFWVGHTGSEGLQKRISNNGIQCETRQPQPGQAAELPGRDSGMANSHGDGRNQAGQSKPQKGGNGIIRDSWSDSVWIPCGDGKQRRIKPGLSPLVDGLPRGVVPSSYQGMAIDADKTAEARVMRISGYGNAIAPALAAEFIKAARGDL